MQGFLRFMLLAGAVLALSTLAAGVALAASVATTGGVVLVSIEPEQGPNLHLPVPVALLRAGLAAADRHSGAELDRTRRQLAPWVSGLDAMAEELEGSPSFVLARIDHHDERIQIAKRGGRLVVDVDAPDARVHVSFPIRLARDFIAFAG